MIRLNFFYIRFFKVLSLKNMSKVSLIVPVYDEGKTVGELLSQLLSLDLFDEIICINDGSTDRSLSELEHFKDRIVLIDLKDNRGKGNALAEGVKEAKNELIMFLDADLYDVSADDLDNMLKPVVNKEVDYVIGFWPPTTLDTKIFKKFSGQRVYHRRDLMPILKRMATSKYGVEVLLNEVFKNKKGKHVYFKDIKHVEKTTKFGKLDGVNRYIQEGVEIALELGRREVFSREDLVILNKIKEVKTYNEVKVLIDSLKSRKIRGLLEEYFKKYLNYVFPRK